MPERHRVAEAERIADREHDVADLHAVERAERDRRAGSSPSAFSTARSDSGSMPLTLRMQLAPVGQHDLDVVGAIDHVMVREHVAFGRDDDAGPEARRAALAAALGELREIAAQHRIVEQRVARAHLLARVDVDDGGHRLLRRIGVAARPAARRPAWSFPAQQHDAACPCPRAAAAGRVAASRRRTAPQGTACRPARRAARTLRSTKDSVCGNWHIIGRAMVARFLR